MGASDGLAVDVFLGGACFILGYGLYLASEAGFLGVLGVFEYDVFFLV